MSVLDFLNKWVARPVGIIGAIITIVVTIQAFAAGDLQRVASLFGLPDMDLTIPPGLVAWWDQFWRDNLPRWLTDLWQLPFAKVVALCFVVVSSTLACWFWCRLFGRFGWLGFILIIPALIGSLWAPAHLFVEWFPGVMNTASVEFAVAQNGAFSRTVTTGGGTVLVLAFLLAFVFLMVTTNAYGNTSDDSGPVFGYVIVALIGGSSLLLATLRDAYAEPPDTALRVCATATTAQIDARQGDLRAFIDSQRPPAAPNLGFLPSNRFIYPWYAVRHACTIERSDSVGHHFRLVVSHATRLEDRTWRCDVGLITGVRGVETVTFQSYALMSSFRGRDCSRYHDGHVGEAVRGYMTAPLFARVYEP